MTEREFAYWLQGFFELSATVDPDLPLGARWSECVRGHITLALSTAPSSGFLLACRAVVDQPRALRAILAEQFKHVIDAGATGYDPVHPAGTMRC